MNRLNKDKKNIINEVLSYFFKSKQFLKNEQCDIFNENKMSGYFEKRLDKAGVVDFEKHLYSCSYCMNVYNKLEHEINILFKSKSEQTSNQLLNNAFDILGIENKKNALELSLSGIVLKIKDTGLEIVEAIKLHDLESKLIPALRDEGNTLSKEIILEADYSNHLFTIIIKFFSKKKIKVEVIFPDGLCKLFKGKQIELSTTGENIQKIISNKMIFEDINPGKYDILVNKKSFFQLNLID